ncbi:MULTISPECIES: hypothetical protein [Butyricimonas]|uniref:hypothetical protein n=1 Tax=Butyricimonas TaxID=574697 RepID=UPI0003A7F3BF|nr:MULTISPECIES: hypothetical protein [Butyricimonas]
MKYSFLLCLLALLLWNCGDDEGNLSPSGLEKNWFVLEDSEDPIDNLRYKIYKDTGFPIYYNDTIGSETRYSPGIGEYTYHEVLQVFYSPGSQTPARNTACYSLVSSERKNVREVLEFVRDEIIPEIPEGTYLPSILLVDSLITPSGDTTVYKGLNTTVLAQVHHFHEMDDAAKSLMKGAFLSSAITSKLALDEAEWLDENFYALSYAVNPSSERIYSQDSRYKYMVSQACGSNVEVRHLGSLGMIGPFSPASKVSSSQLSLPHDPYHPEMWYVPTKEQDLQLYCQAVLAFTEEEFMERYATNIKIWGYDERGGMWPNYTPEEVNPSKDRYVDFPVVIAKYKAIKAKLQEYGFIFK